MSRLLLQMQQKDGLCQRIASSRSQDASVFILNSDPHVLQDRTMVRVMRVIESEQRSVVDIRSQRASMTLALKRRERKKEGYCDSSNLLQT